MPLTEGRMHPDQEMRIRHNMDKLCENIEARELSDFFVQEEIFDFPDLELINGCTPNTRSRRNECFFSLLFESGPRAYDVFLKALKRQKQEYLVDEILNTNMADNNQQPADPGQWIYTIPNRKAQLQDKDLARLCKTLGANWELAMYELGLKQNEVWRCKEDNRNSALLQIYSALSLWRRKNVQKAHLEAFVTAISKCDLVEIEWDELKAVAANLE